MPDLAALCLELQDTWRREIPLAAAMDIAVVGYDRHRLEVRAPLPPNRNLHGTAFAGSLFSICVLTGWGTAWLALRERDLSGHIVVADSTIRYRRAVTTDLICSCETDPAAATASLDELARAGRADLALRCSLDSAGRPAVSFEATYVVHAATAAPQPRVT